jgi:hypothetical protein
VTLLKNVLYIGSKYTGSHKSQYTGSLTFGNLSQAGLVGRSRDTLPVHPLVGAELYKVYPNSQLRKV